MAKKDRLDQKAAAAAKKQEAEQAAKEAAAKQFWDEGANTKAAQKKAAQKAAEEAKMKAKAEKKALEEEDDRNTPGRSQPKNTRKPGKKNDKPEKRPGGLDLSQLDDDGPLATLNASGIDNALDALSLTASSSDAKIDRHPERRYKAAYAQYEERRLREMESDGTGQGLRLNQKKEKIKKEFEKSPENPFNQLSARYDASKDELTRIKDEKKEKMEGLLAETSSK